MKRLARVNLHLKDDVLTINAHYLLSISFEKVAEEMVSQLQLYFKAAFWEGRQAFPDKGYLLQKALLGRDIRAISLLTQDGQLHFYQVPFHCDSHGGNHWQRSGLLEDGTLAIRIGEQ